MKTIHKYPLASCTGMGKYTITIHKKSRLLCVGEQKGVITLWAEVDTDEILVTRKLTILGTGWELPENLIYLGTVFVGPFVWHVYEDTN